MISSKCELNSDYLVREGLFTWPSNSPHLLGSCCPHCSRIFFPTRRICPDCFKDETLTTIELSNHGTLYTYCVLRRGPMGFESPYAIGYVDLPEGLRIFAF